MFEIVEIFFNTFLYCRIILANKLKVHRKTFINDSGSVL